MSSIWNRNSELNNLVFATPVARRAEVPPQAVGYHQTTASLFGVGFAKRPRDEAPFDPLLEQMPRGRIPPHLDNKVPYGYDIPVVFGTLLHDKSMRHPPHDAPNYLQLQTAFGGVKQ